MAAPIHVTVLGAGTWGMSLAHVLHDAGHAVRVWEFVPDVVATLERTRRHPKLPRMVIPPDMHFSNDLAAMVKGAEILVCAVPSEHLRDTARAVVRAGYAGQPVIVGSKGIEAGTHALSAEVWAQELGAAGAGKVGVLYGPSLADEVSVSLPTTVVASAEDRGLMDRIQRLFQRPWFHVYLQPDLRGVELCGALKNVIAIACGVSDGLGYGTNAKAALMTRGLGEMVKIGVAMGAQAQTFYGMAGIGDLIVTCTSPHGRNWKYGSLLGQGRTSDQALAEVAQVVEGRYTVRAARELGEKLGLTLPIVRGVYEVAYDGRSAQAIAPSLLPDDPYSEIRA
jgi:glycerol-3-phosphate dehydrogenase (NAD(P)+)